MKVLKFGGTSVGTVASLKNVKQIVESGSKPAIIVVSALGGVTDMLIATSKLAADGNQEYQTSFDNIVKRHYDIIENLVPEDVRADLKRQVDVLFDELSNIYRGISLIKDLSERTLNIVVSYGERLSSLIISKIIKDATLYDSRNFIKTVNEGGKNVLETETTARLVYETFRNKDFKIALVPGFISTDLDGHITNLGRGGSDYTASILAANLNAEALEIWTDVDGFMTADPRLIDSAYVIDKLSYVEAMELCNFGAKVIYPPTIYPAFHKDIPLVIKNTFNPSAPGTLVSDSTSLEGKPIKGISSINDTCLITVTGLGMVGIVGINARIFNTLARNGVSVFLVSQASSENNTSFAVKNADADLAVRVLKEEFRAELQSGQLSDIVPTHDLATVAIVGQNMKGTAGIAGKLFGTLGRNGINVIAVAQGASEINISFVIRRSQLQKALNVIHDSLFLSETKVMNIFVTGTGNVGRKLIEQIRKQQKSLHNEKSLDLKVVGIANSRHIVFDIDGINLDNYKELLEASTLKSTPQNIVQGFIDLNLFNSIFVDCTTSKEIADLYKPLLDNNINIVAANKTAASSAYSNYESLKKTALLRDVKFLFETNVGAGLPIISTINNLINSGDRILKIEAVVSGTLNYIFDVLSPDTPFSKAVALARENGFSEPDPRVDLSGGDVVKKIVILAREGGYHIEQSDVEKELFVPADLFGGDVDSFFKRLPALDTEFEKKRHEAEAGNRKFRFIATLDSNGRATARLRTVGPEHPFHSLQSSNNIIAITTDRYKDFPIIIQGYGAGADVTAAGVFADIMSIANVR
ncbi:MAG: bifunctional aspartate kinase/homoserine dehydrogenase I [Muribaculaceae bacterium]|nr:bifunctional aspartate kinase/homoserine dehydrogenase I [Muribaculaceae bacterium]